jgi:hypothetical protein
MQLAVLYFTTLTTFVGGVAGFVGVVPGVVVSGLVVGVVSPGFCRKAR